MTTISIITAVRNGSATIGGALASLTEQSIPCEHLVIDGASTDATVDIVRRLSPSSRIFTEPDHGIYDAMNKGIRLASGDIIGILNADDYYPSADVLAQVIAVFKDPTVMSCYGDLEYVKKAGSGLWAPGKDEIQNSNLRNKNYKVVRYWQSGSFTPEKFKWGWMPPHPTFFVRRSVYERYGDFRLDMGSAADYELMLRLLLKERITTAYIPETMVRMRVGGASNASLQNRLKANRMDRLAWTVNGLRPYPWTLLCKPLRKLGQYFFR